MENLIILHKKLLKKEEDWKEQRQHKKLNKKLTIYVM